MIEQRLLFGLLGRVDDCMSSVASSFSAPPPNATLVYKKRILLQSFHDDCLKRDRELGLKVNPVTGEYVLLMDAE